MSANHSIRILLATFFFILFSLGLVALNSANAFFAMTLRDRIRSNSINTDDRVLNSTFEKVQSDVLAALIIAAIATTILSFYGISVLLRRKSVQDHVAGLVAAQIVVALCMIATGAYCADRVHGFETSFNEFGSHDQIPYYALMFYGGIAQALYGFASIILTVLFLAIDFNRNDQGENEPAEIEGVASKHNEKDFP